MAVAENQPLSKVQRRLKVAVLNRNFSPTAGGAERYSTAIVEELAAQHDIHVFAQTIEHNWPCVTYHRISRGFSKPRWLNQLWYAYAVWRATRTGFDIIHSHEAVWFGNVQTMHVKTVQRSLLGGRSGLALALRQIKIILSPRLQTYLGLERARIKPQTLRAVLAASQPLADELLQEYPHVAPMLSVITPGVNIPVQFATKSEARRAISTEENGKIILFVANDYVRKGLPALLQAMQTLPDDIRLLVVGNASQIPQFEAIAKTLGIEYRVQFLGPLKDMHLVYCAADVLAHPTLEDSFGMVVLEAMAHGLPVLVSRAPYCGLSALLQPGQQALVLDDPKDVSNLTAALLRLLEDVSLRQTIATGASDFAKGHTWKQAGAAYSVIYQKLSA